MRKETSAYILLALMAIMIVSMFAVLPASAFINPDTSTDNLYEFYGPHVDMVQNKLYVDTESMWTALGGGEVDICDWPLDPAFRTEFSQEPYLSNITVVTAGGEAGYYQVDFNHNYHSTLGQIMPYVSNATYKYGVDDPNGRPNPVYLNDSAYWNAYHLVFPPISSNMSFRLGVDSLFNRTDYEKRIGDSYIQILTVVPSYMGGYIWTGCPGYVYSRVLAETYFAAGKIKCDAGSGWKRYWDLNNDGVAQQPELTACVIKFTWRADKARKTAGLMLRDELVALNFTMHPTLTGERNFDTNYQQAMLDKNYHMTTFGWIYVGPDPDFIYDTYHIANYWDDPGSSCPNTAGLNDSVLNKWSEMVKFNETAVGAKLSAIEWQKQFWAINAHLALCSTNRYMANRKYYSGGTGGQPTPTDDGENRYREGPNDGKRYWYGLCNQAGVGSNSWFSLLNAYPNCYLYGDNGKMTLRYGWSQQAAPTHMNPMVSEWYWDAILIGEIYDTMGYRDPYDLSTWKGDIAKSWKAGTWYDSNAKMTKSKVTVTIRSDAKWQDGKPVTMADVVYSLTEAGKTMIAEGYPPPWWWPTGSQVCSLTMIDAFTVEILYNVQSFLAESWTLGFYIIPKHIWKPIIDDANPHPPTATVPDPNLIGSGPFRYANRTSLQSVLLVANKPNSVVKTDEAGSVPITSPGYHAYCPIHVNTHTLMKLTNVSPYYGEDPFNTIWHMEKPYYSLLYNITAFNLPNPEFPPLNQSAWITIHCLNPETVPGVVIPEGYYHVFLLKSLGGGNYELYLDWYNARLLIPHASGVAPHEPLIMPTEFGITIENLANITHLVVNKYVYVDGVLQPGYPKDITLDRYAHDKELLNIDVPKCMHNVTVAVHIKGPSTLDDGHPNPWISQWINYTAYTWTTILEDIGGTTYYDRIGLGSYPFKAQLTVPDCKVDIKDILTAAKAFGSLPGVFNWNSIADANRDYKVDIKDILTIAKAFGAIQ
jgi:hypothetical protein